MDTDVTEISTVLTNIYRSLSTERFFHRISIFCLFNTKKHNAVSLRKQNENCTCLTLSIFNFFAAEYTSFTSSLSAFNLLKKDGSLLFWFFTLMSTLSSSSGNYLLSSIGIIQQNFNSFRIEIIKLDMGNSMRITVAVEDFKQVGTAASQHGSVCQHLMSTYLHLNTKQKPTNCKNFFRSMNVL